MHKLAAELRHRELTQELYNIGDEVVEYIEHLAEAVRDYDAELTQECLLEFGEIVQDARVDSRRIVGELIGLRQALTTGVRAGLLSVSVPDKHRLPEPEVLDGEGLLEIFPLPAEPVGAQAVADTVQERTELVGEHLADIVHYVLEQTDVVARDLNAVSLPHLFSRAGTLVALAVEGWQHQVVGAHPAYTRLMRGQHPPRFLAERARIDAVVAKVAAKKAAARDRNFAS